MSFLLMLFFFVTMFVTGHCWNKDKVIGRLSSLQPLPLSENPLLGPSHSSLGGIGARHQRFLTENHLNWHLFTFPCLHAGAIHLVINLCIVIFIGWAVRIGLVHSVSAFVRTLVDALFVRNCPAAGASGALSGLHGVMFAVVAPLFCFSVVSVVLSLLSYVGKFSNIGGFVYGLLVGLVPLFSPQLWKFSQGLFKYDIKDSNWLRLKQNVDRLAGYVVLVLQGVNVSQYCKRCQYIDCVPFKWWSCTDKVTSSEDWILAEPMDMQGNTAMKRQNSEGGRSAPSKNLVIKGGPSGGNEGDNSGSYRTKVPPNGMKQPTDLEAYIKIYEYSPLTRETEEIDEIVNSGNNGDEFRTNLYRSWSVRTGLPMERETPRRRKSIWRNFQMWFISNNQDGQGECLGAMNWDELSLKTHHVIVAQLNGSTSLLDD